MMMHAHHHDYLFNDDHPVQLDEMTYKDIMGGVKMNQLPHKDYAKLIKMVNYVGRRRNIFKYFVPNKYDGWNTYIQFMDYNEQAGDLSLKANDAARLLLWSGDIRLHCNCPAFKFWGYQYILTQLDAAIRTENRFPHIRNPQLKGTVCKHAKRTLKVLPFHLGDIAAAIKEDRLACR